MLADQLDYVVGVDPHRDSHALAVVRSSTARSCSRRRSRQTAMATRRRSLADEHAPRWARVRGRRYRLVRCRPDPLPRPAVASGCSRSAGCGGTAARAARPTRSTRSGGPQRARRASGRRRPGQAVNARRCRHWWPHAKAPSTPSAPALCQLRDLLITTPEPLRSELRPLTRARLLQRLAATRPDSRRRRRAARQPARARARSLAGSCS